MSEWNIYYQPAYREWLEKSGPLDEQSLFLLRRHAELRRARTDRGFELAYFTDDDLEVASARAVERRWLTVEEIAAERQILEHFEKRLAPLYDENIARLARFRAQAFSVDRELAPTIERFAHFVGGLPSLPLTLVLVAKPRSTDEWKFESWRSPILVEMPDRAPRVDTLLGPILGAFLFRSRAEIRLTARSCGDGLGTGELQSAIEHAFTDYQHEKRDPDELLRADLLRSNLRSDGLIHPGNPGPWIRQRRLALVLSRSVKAAIRDGQTLSQFLPSVCAPWQKLVADYAVPASVGRD